MTRAGRRGRLPVLLSLAALAAAAALAPARAAADWFPGAPVRPPGVARTGGLDLARDGTGGVAWVAGGALDFSALVHGRFSAPAPVAAGAPRDVSDPVLAAGRGGALAVAWNSSGRIYAAYRRPGRVAFDAPVLVWAGGPAAGPPALDLAGRQKALLAFSAGGDVHAETLAGGRWRRVPGVLDAAPAANAGSGTDRPAVAMSSDGTGIAAWGEAGRIEVRRVRGTAASVAVADAGAGDDPLVGTGDDDSLALVAWRTLGGEQARRLRGGAFDDVGAIPGGGPAALVVTGGGGGLLAAAPLLEGPLALAPVGGGEVLGAPAPLGPATLPAVAAAEHVFTFAGWLGGGTVQAVRRTRTALGPVTPLAPAALGAVAPGGGLLAAADAAGDALMAWIQTPAGGVSRLVVGGYAGPPVAPAGIGPGTTRASRPVIGWTASRSPWVPRYEVSIDNVPAGATGRTSLRAPRTLRDGRHRVRVGAVGADGRRAVSRPASVVVDTRPPTVTVAFAGTRARGGVRLVVRASDGSGSGLHSLSVRWGDGSSTTTATSRASHAYRGTGSFPVRVVARDRAGNVRSVRRIVGIAADSVGHRP